VLASSLPFCEFSQPTTFQWTHPWNEKLLCVLCVVFWRPVTPFPGREGNTHTPPPPPSTHCFVSEVVSCEFSVPSPTSNPILNKKETTSQCTKTSWTEWRVEKRSLFSASSLPSVRIKAVTTCPVSLSCIPVFVLIITSVSSILSISSFPFLRNTLRYNHAHSLFRFSPVCFWLPSVFSYFYGCSADQERNPVFCKPKDQSSHS
jgi:hypothetical protein